jgi:hypothetical protein
MEPKTSQSEPIGRIATLHAEQGGPYNFVINRPFFRKLQHPFLLPLAYTLLY